ncbi:hypothetical protein ABK040_005136 [Willaertia magna]
MPTKDTVSEMMNPSPKPSQLLITHASPVATAVLLNGSTSLENNNNGGYSRLRSHSCVSTPTSTPTITPNIPTIQLNENPVNNDNVIKTEENKTLPQLPTIPPISSSIKVSNSLSNLESSNERKNINTNHLNNSTPNLDNKDKKSNNTNIGTIYVPRKSSEFVREMEIRLQRKHSLFSSIFGNLNKPRKSIEKKTSIYNNFTIKIMKNILQFIPLDITKYIVIYKKNNLINTLYGKFNGERFLLFTHFLINEKIFYKFKSVNDFFKIFLELIPFTKILSLSILQSEDNKIAKKEYLEFFNSFLQKCKNLNSIYLNNKYLPNLVTLQNIFPKEKIRSLTIGNNYYHLSHQSNLIEFKNLNYLCILNNQDQQQANKNNNLLNNLINSKCIEFINIVNTLNYLELSKMELTNDELKYIFLSKVTTLKLEYLKNKLTLKNLTFLKENKNLRNLKIIYCFGENAGDVICINTAHHLSLKYLDISGLDVTNEGINYLLEHNKIITKFIFKNIVIKNHFIGNFELNENLNNIELSNIQFKSFNFNNNLKYLTLKNCNLDNNQMSHIFEMKNLVYLDVSKNRLNDKLNLYNFSSSNLKYLNLSYNLLTHNVFKRNEIFNFTKIESLNVNNMNIRDEGFASILIIFPNLKELEANSCGLTNLSIMMIAENKNIKVLKINNNYIRLDKQAITSLFETNQSLTSLHIISNYYKMNDKERKLLRNILKNNKNFSSLILTHFYKTNLLSSTQSIDEKAEEKLKKKCFNIYKIKFVE